MKKGMSVDDNMNNPLESAIGGLGGDPSVDTPIGLGKAKYHGHEEEDRAAVRERVTSAIASSQTSLTANPIRGGYIEIDPTELGERGEFYPSGWKFYVKPASVDDIKNWSSIDEERIDQVNDVFNEIIRSCVKTVDGYGVTMGWNKINSWDRFWFLLKVREYTFDKGEKELKYTEECPECGEPVIYTLTSSSLSFDLPDRDVIDRHWNRESREWIIDPKEYDVNGPTLHFYAPTIEKDQVIFNWLLKRQNEGKKINETFVKFLPWLLKRVSKDENVNEKFITEAEGTYKMWNKDMFALVDDIIRNIQITPGDKLKTLCEHCEEEVASPIRFPDGVRGLFAVSSGHKKFGSK